MRCGSTGMNASLAAGHIRFPLLNSPERCRQARTGSFRFPKTPPKRPKRRPRRGGSALRLHQPAGTPGGFMIGVANRQSPTEPNPRRTRGIPLRLMDSSQMPPLEGPEGPLQRTVLRWFSPQSSVPRQTVGHHARAAMYEMGLNNLRRLPWRGAQCEPDGPPTGPFQIPTDRGAGRGTEGRADAPAAGFRKTHLVWGSLKIDSRSYKRLTHTPARTPAPVGRGGR